VKNVRNLQIIEEENEKEIMEGEDSSSIYTSL
jgi:hypothetical protein